LVKYVLESGATRCGPISQLAHFVEVQAGTKKVKELLGGGRGAESAKWFSPRFTRDDASKRELSPEKTAS